MAWGANGPLQRYAGFGWSPAQRVEPDRRAIAPTAEAPVEEKKEGEKPPTAIPPRPTGWGSRVAAAAWDAQYGPNNNKD